MTQDEAAEKLGVNRITVYSWERGTYKPSADMLLKISEVYRCTIDELLKGEEKK
jgi:DNA-binding XRE family transcriptional regulator